MGNGVKDASRTPPGPGVDASGAPVVEKTHCGYGHEFTPENTYIRPGGRRDCRICKARRSAASAARHPARERARQRAYVEAHRQETLDRQRSWRARTRLTHLARRRRYYQQHAEALRAARRLYGQTHKAEARAYGDAYNHAHPEVARARARKRRARLNGISQHRSAEH